MPKIYTKLNEKWQLTQDMQNIIFKYLKLSQIHRKTMNMSKRITNGQRTSIYSLIAQTHNSNKIFSPIKFSELENDCWGIPWPLLHLCWCNQLACISEGQLIIIVIKALKSRSQLILM